MSRSRHAARADARKSKDELIEEIESLRRRLGELEQMEGGERKGSFDPLMEWLRQVYREAPIGLCYFDRNLRFVFINNFLAEINGISVEEHLGRSIREVIPDVSAGVEVQLRQVIETGEPIIGGEVDAETPAYPGLKRSFQHHYYAINSEAGTVLGIACVVQDVTERKRAEEALQKSEALFRSFIDNLPTEIFVRDTTGRFALVNRAWERVQGLSSQDVIGKTAYDIYPKDQADIYAAQDRAVLETGQALDRELEFREGNGSHFLHTIKFPIPGADGEVTAIGGIAVDITERKRAEQALRESEARLSKATEMAKIGYWVWDEVEDKAIYCSDELAKMCGVASGADLAAVLTSHAANLEWVHPDDRERFDEAVWTARETKRGYDIEYRIVNLEGEVRHLHEMEEAVVDQHGDLIRTNGVTHDITDRKRVEEEIRKLNAELEQRVEERTAELRAAQTDLLRQERMATLGQLSAMVSHELRNPLGVIRTSAFVVCDGLKEEAPRARRALERIERSVIRCDRIIDEMLDFTRISELEVEMVPIDTWLAGVLEEQIVPREVTLHNEFALPGVGVGLDGDRLRRAVINVFDNACQAMKTGASERSENGEHRLTVRTGAAAGRIELVFEDTGPGIPPEALPKVFEPLFSTKNFGVGLGLSVVHQIMEQHGGGVEIENIAGGGVRVCLWLPGGEPGP